MLSPETPGSSHQYLLFALLLHFLLYSASGVVLGHSQPLISKFLYDAMNGECAQLVLIRPPCVAQSSAFHIELYTPIGCVFGYANPWFSKLACSLIGVSSTRNLLENETNISCTITLFRYFHFEIKKLASNLMNLHYLTFSPQDRVRMKLLGWIKPKLQSLFSVADSIDIHIGLNQVRLSSSVA